MDDTQTVSFETIEEASSFDIPEPMTLVIEDQSKWNELWGNYWNLFDADGNKTPAPEIDFEKERVVIAAWGMYPEGCSNSVDIIKAVTQKNNQVVVELDSVPDLGMCMAIVYPIQVIKIPRSDLPVVFSHPISDAPETGPL